MHIYKLKTKRKAKNMITSMFLARFKLLNC